jgi:hypothetical protein
MAAENIRVLVPRVRRAVEGVGQVALLTDEQIKDLIADALATVILHTGGVFGKQLLVAERDPVTNVPVEYETSESLTLPEGSVVAYQAAIDHFFFALRDLKVQESIRDEGQEWTYTLSATLIRDHLRYLQEQRDRALNEVGPTPVAYVDFLHERDRYVFHYGGQEVR